MTLYLLLVPLISAFAVLGSGPLSRPLTILATVMQLVIAAKIAYLFPHGAADSLRVDIPWIADFGIHFSLDIDGISLLLVLLTNLLCMLIVISVKEDHKLSCPSFYFLLLLTQTALIGVFLARDAFLFYVFWEMTLIPIFFMMLKWGGDHRHRTTLKFFLYTLLGSLFMLIGILYLYLHSPLKSFAISNFYSVHLSAQEQRWLFWAFFIAFAIKIPVFPLHTWQPQTYTQAPTAGTMLLAGLLLKMGLYGLIRWLLPIVPLALLDWSKVILILAITGVVYGSWIALSQDHLKTLFAYSSLAHVGLITAGIFTLSLQGLQGALLQMVAHGINVFGLFYAAEIIFSRTQTYDLNQCGGIRKKSPVFAACFMIIVLGSMALPLTNGFVGEFLLLNSIFQVHHILAAVAGISVILGAVYLLRMYQRTMLGETTTLTAKFIDLEPREILILLPVAALVIALGVYPQPLLNLTEASILEILQHL